jgi:hypothetical protein
MTAIRAAGETETHLGNEPAHLLLSRLEAQ